MVSNFSKAVLSFFLLCFVVTAPTFAKSGTDNGKGHKGHHNQSKSYFIAPDVTSGSNVNGVDIASGRLNRSDTDLTSSTLSLSRSYSDSGWNHQYASRLLLSGVDYDNWQGLTSEKYKKQHEACTSGWDDIKATLFNGQLSSAKSKYKHGLCQISLNGKVKAEYVVYRAHNNHNNAVVLTRPNGTSMTFVKSHNSWKPLSGAPFSLKKSGNSWSLNKPSDSVETYDYSGKLIKLTSSNQQKTRLRYNQSGQLRKVIGPFGKTLKFTYSNDKVSSVEGALGTVNYAYADNRLSSVTKVDGSVMTYQYDASKLSAIVDALGQTIANYTYDSQDRVISYSGQGGTQATSYDYSNSGTDVSNVANNATDSYAFDIVRGIAKQISMTDVAGSTTSQSYDDNGYPYESTGINGTKSRTIYNDDGLLVKRIESVGLDNEKSTITEWHKDYRKPVLQVEDAIEVGNKATESTYNNKGLLVKRIEGVINKVSYSHHGHGNGHKNKGHHGNGKGHGHHGHNHKPTITLKDKRITRYRYNNKGQVVKTIAPNGAVTLTSYDADGNRTGGANALGHENKTLSFDATGKPLVSEDANGIQTNNVYDSAGRLSSTTSNGRTTNYNYDVAGRQTGITYPDGSSTTNEYDTAGNLTKTIDQDGNISVSSFDSNGNQTSTQVTDAHGTVILSSASEYNNQNQLVKSIDAQGNETSYVYDASGNQVSVTDANGNTTQNQYDANNRLVKMVDALGGETDYAYDSDGNRTSVTAPNGSTTTFAYDSFDQMSTEVSSDRGTSSYQYNNSGNQTQFTDANGNEKNVSYDVLNRKTGESWTGAPDLTITYTYDSCDNGVGKLCSVADKSGSTSFAYDTKGQVAQKAQNIDGIELTKTYAYNNEGKLISETYPSGAVIAYIYNVDEVQSISIDGNPYMTDISYNAANQLIGWNWADGTAYAKTYDANGRLSTFPLANDTRTLAYDANGNITGWTDNGKTEAKSFAYDALNRLTDYNKADASTTLEDQLFSYDANGNRTQLLEDSVQTIYNILAESNRLEQVGATQYQYDTNGNIIDDGEHSYSYDARNRLTGVDGTSAYLFNANNMRVKKATPAGTVLYGWDNDRIFAEYDDQGNAIQETVYFGSAPVALLKDGNVFRVFADQIDTPRVLADNANTVLWAWDSKPFGESVPNEDVDGDGTSLSYNLRFPGQYYDVETEKHYNFNRDYNPVTGRYIQSDPIGISSDIGTYTYSENSILHIIDPTGLAGIYARDVGATQHIVPFIARLKQTTSGLQLFSRIFNSIPEKVYLYSTVNPDFPNDGPTVSKHGSEYRIYMPLSWAHYIRQNNVAGTCSRMSTMRILAHELGHIANWAASEEETVDTWEDPVMFEIEGFRRVTYTNAFANSICF